MLDHDIVDLGDIQKPVLIFGGTYSNLQATQALKNAAEHYNIPPERCICTGDIVAYCGQPNETVALIREWGVHCLLGNCEESFADNSDDCGCGFDDGSQCDLLSGQWFSFSNQRLSKSDRAWFSTFPRYIRFHINGISSMVVHGSASSINQFIFSSSKNTVFLKEFSLTDTDLILGGHSGIPFTKRIDDQTWHNTGAVGMPANDGETHTWFSIIAPTENGIKIDNRALHYPHHETFQIMQQEGLANGYADCLLSGLWPSTDILPEIEKEKTGKKVRAHSEIISKKTLVF